MDRKIWKDFFFFLLLSPLLTCPALLLKTKGDTRWGKASLAVPLKSVLLHLPVGYPVGYVFAFATDFRGRHLYRFCSPAEQNVSVTTSEMSWGVTCLSSPFEVPGRSAHERAGWLKHLGNTPSSGLAVPRQNPVPAWDCTELCAPAEELMLSLVRPFLRDTRKAVGLALGYDWGFFSTFNLNPKF